MTLFWKEVNLQQVLEFTTGSETVILMNFIAACISVCIELG